jgi:hypothetical protein
LSGILIIFPVYKYDTLRIRILLIFTAALLSVNIYGQQSDIPVQIEGNKFDPSLWLQHSAAWGAEKSVSV